MCLCVPMCTYGYIACLYMHAFGVCLHTHYIDNVPLFVCLHLYTYALCRHMSMHVECMHVWTVGQGRRYKRYLHYITHLHWSVLSVLLNPWMRLVQAGAFHLYVEWRFFSFEIENHVFIPKDWVGWYFKNNSSHSNLRPWKKSSIYDPNLFSGPEPKAFSLAGEWIPFHSF